MQERPSTEMSTHPLQTGGELVYQNLHQQVFRVETKVGAYAKEYFVVDTGHKAGMVVAQGESVLLVKQYRLLIDGVSAEIPGGRVDDGETPIEGAVRECVEESGIRCLNPRPLLFYHAGLDTSYNPTHLFWTDQIAEETEEDSIHRQEVRGHEWVPLDRCMEMISRREILDSFSILALLSYRIMRDRS